MGGWEHAHRANCPGCCREYSCACTQTPSAGTADRHCIWGFPPCKVAAVVVVVVPDQAAAAAHLAPCLLLYRLVVPEGYVAVGSTADGGAAPSPHHLALYVYRRPGRESVLQVRGGGGCRGGHASIRALVKRLHPGTPRTTSDIACVYKGVRGVMLCVCGGGGYRRRGRASVLQVLGYDWGAGRGLGPFVAVFRSVDAVAEVGHADGGWLLQPPNVPMHTSSLTCCAA